MKCTVLYDSENQLAQKQELIDWNLSCKLIFEAYRIKDQEPFDVTSIESQDIFIILIGPSTRYLNKLFTKRVEDLIASEKLICCLNLNQTIGLDEEFCPKFLFDVGAIHMPFSKEDASFILNNAKLESRKHDRTSSYHFKINFSKDNDY